MAHDPRYHEEWPEISRYVRLLFNHHCARCGRDCSNPKDSREMLQVHHIDENPGNNNLENLIPLCSVCHLQIEKEARLHAPHAPTGTVATSSRHHGDSYCPGLPSLLEEDLPGQRFDVAGISMRCNTGHHHIGPTQAPKACTTRAVTI